MTDFLTDPDLDLVLQIWTVVAPALLVAVLRMTDVTLNVFRTVFTVNGRRGLAALFHAAEGGVWLAAAGIVLTDLTIVKAVGYLVGVAMGTLLGTTIVERLRMGMSTVRIYCDHRHEPGAGEAVAAVIRAHGFGATTFEGRGLNGPVTMILSTVPRRRVPAVRAAAESVTGDLVMAVDNELHAMTNTARV